MVRAASLPDSLGTQRTSIGELDSGTWVRNVIFSRLDDNLVGRSVDHPRCCRRWSVGHLRCCEDGGNLRFSRQAGSRGSGLASREDVHRGEIVRDALVALFLGFTAERLSLVGSPVKISLPALQSGGGAE